MCAQNLGAGAVCHCEDREGGVIPYHGYKSFSWEFTHVQGLLGP